MTPPNGWRGPDDELGRYIAKVSQSMLNAYREAPDLVTEHANLERDTAQGGYRHRQLFELVQNGADALSPVSEAGSAATRPPPVPGAGRIEVWLVDDFLYCADNGSPIDEAGVRALMFSHMSPKRATAQKIGTFGLGFKSLLTVSDAPEFYSRSGSLCFDGERARQRISEVVPDADRYPVLRVADPIDPRECRGSETGHELMKWASNIVRLPLKPDAYRGLHNQLKDFPAEFLLFVKHVRRLRLTDDSPVLDRVLRLSAADGAWRLCDDERESSWKLFEARCVLSPDASGDGWDGDSLDSVPLMWASPLDRLDLPGKFWAYFPTETPSLVAGILNAPWKTNQDRQNLLPGPFNDELIRAAAQLIADNLPELATGGDPARHLDALPRRHEAGDPWQLDLLRDQLFSTIRRRPILPDQDGRLKRRDELSYAPSALASSPRQSEEARDLWASHEARPADWLHHRALTPNRMARVNVLFESDPESAFNAAPRAPVGRWLEALVAASRARDPVGASKAALRIAALLDQTRPRPADLGEILLTANRAWRQPDPERIFLPYESPTVGTSIDPRSCVHPELVADRDTLQALRKLGFKERTHENRFRMLAQRVLQGGGAPVRDVERREFWISSRRNDPRTALGVIEEFLTPRSRDSRGGLGVLTRSGTWAAPHSVLLPGSIVPGDGGRHADATVDMDFHRPDERLLAELGVVERPQRMADLSFEPSIARTNLSARISIGQAADIASGRGKTF